MTIALATLLLLALGATPAGTASPPARDAWTGGAKAVAVPVVRQDESGPEKPTVRLETADDVARLCRILEPAERVRPAGDAVERGEAEAKQDVSRAAALKERYHVRVPAAKLAFAPYDAPE